MTNYFTNPRILKRPIPAWEISPFVLNGDLYRAGFRRAWTATAGSGIVIEKYDAVRDVFYAVGVLPTDRYLGSALVAEDGRLIIFTTTDVDSTQNQVVAREVNSENWTWKCLEWLVYTAPPGHKVYNTSVTHGPHGYVMALETDEGSQPFSMRFIGSPDLLTWAPIGALCYEDFYWACPTIRYAEDGWYLVSGMWQNQTPAGVVFESVMCRTCDFINIVSFHGNADFGAYYNLMSPGACEGNNNSDVDFIEWNGRVYFTYMTGDQQTWAFNNDAWFDGTLSDLHRMYWPA